MGRAIATAAPARWPPRSGSQRRPRRPDRGRRYGLLLATLIANFLLSAFSGRGAASDIQVVLFVLALFLALRMSPLPRRWPMMINIFAVAGSVVVLGALLTGSRAVVGLADSWKALMLLVTAVLVIRDVMTLPSVTIQSIYGALSAYLIIGLMFASLYSAIDHLSLPDFFTGNEPANPQTFQYFSFTTLTTLGYGDFTAAGNSGRVLAVLEALIGQVFLATLVARLVAAFRPAASRDSHPARSRRDTRGGGTSRRGSKPRARQPPGARQPPSARQPRSGRRIPGGRRIPAGTRRMPRRDGQD